MHRWLRLHAPLYDGAVSTVSTRALMVEYFGGSPRAKNGIRPHRSTAPSRSPCATRTTGTSCVGATLNEVFIHSGGACTCQSFMAFSCTRMMYRPHMSPLSHI